MTQSDLSFSNNNLYRRLYYPGFLAYTVLFVLAIVWYKERVIILDTAFHIFNILKNEAFTIQNNRYGAVVTQVFPLLCAKLGLSLKTSMIIYSCSFVLWPVICYWLCGHVLKQYRLALCLLLYNTLLVSHTFYWALSEQGQGLAFLFVLFSLLTTQVYMHQALKITLLVCGAVMAAFFHPILVLPLVFIILYLAFSKQHGTSKWLFYSISACTVLAFLLKQQFFTTAYESSATQNSYKLFTYLNHWYSLPSAHAFLSACTGRFIWLPVCTLLISAILIYLRFWPRMILFTGYLIAYVLLITTAYENSGTIDLYIENLYLPLGLIIALPVVYDVLPVLHTRKLAFPLMVLILATGLIRIYTTHHIYSERLDWQRSFMHKNTGRKLLIAETPALKDKLIMTWGTPFEFWLLSTTETGKTESIYIADDIDKFWKDHWDRKSFIMPWGAVPYESLPARYFKLTDTISRYEFVKSR